MVGIGAQRQGSLSGGLGCLPVAGVVLDAADEQGHPACLDQDLPVLFEGHPLVPHGGHPAKPGPSFGEQLVSRHERVFRAQPVSHDSQTVERGLVQI